MNDLPPKFQEFLSRLEGLKVHKPGLSWSACCPAHGDAHPSLSVNVGHTGNLVVTCHSVHGCLFPAIVKAVGMSPSDLFPGHKEGFENFSYQRPPDVVYPYLRADGTYAYEVCRYNSPKSFRQRRANPAWRPGSSEPRYFWNLDGVELVLYRLPQLLAWMAEHPDYWIALVEGEKCAEAVSQMGPMATTHTRGAAGWSRHYRDTLAGHNVAIFYDMDRYHERDGERPSQEWAIRAARDLYDVCPRVRVCRPPGCLDDSKEDIADYVQRTRGPGQRIDREKIKREIFDVIQQTTDYYPGWERHTRYESLQRGHRELIRRSPPANMNDVIEMVQRRLDAALNNVRLGSLPSDLAEAAAWCQWLAEGIDPRTRHDNIRLGPTPPPDTDSGSRQSSDAKSSGDTREEDATGSQDATQENAPEAGAARPLCLPAEDEEFIEPL